MSHCVPLLHRAPVSNPKSTAEVFPKAAGAQSALPCRCASQVPPELCVHGSPSASRLPPHLHHPLTRSDSPQTAPRKQPDLQTPNQCCSALTTRGRRSKRSEAPENKVLRRPPQNPQERTRRTGKRSADGKSGAGKAEVPLSRTGHAAPVAPLANSAPGAAVRGSGAGPSTATGNGGPQPGNGRASKRRSGQRCHTAARRCPGFRRGFPDLPAARPARPLLTQQQQLHLLGRLLAVLP